MHWTADFHMDPEFYSHPVRLDERRDVWNWKPKWRAGTLQEAAEHGQHFALEGLVTHLILRGYSADDPCQFAMRRGFRAVRVGGMEYRWDYEGRVHERPCS